jgi:hypothetical protein
MVAMDNIVRNLTNEVEPHYRAQTELGTFADGMDQGGAIPCHLPSSLSSFLFFPLRET